MDQEGGREGRMDGWREGGRERGRDRWIDGGSEDEQDESCLVMYLLI